MGTTAGRLSGVGMLIRQWRGARSQRAYGAAIGVSNVAVLKLERGDALPSWQTTAAICADAGLSGEERRAFLDMLLDVGSGGATRANPAANRQP